MKIRNIVLAAAAAVALGATAQAEGWTGYYVGLDLGVTDADANYRTDIASGGYLAASNITQIQNAMNGLIEDDSFVGGVHAGVNWGHGRWIIGLEIDAQSVGTTNERISTQVYSCCAVVGATYTAIATIEQDYQATARLRIAIPTEKALFFVSGGYAMTSVDMTETFRDTHFPIAGFTRSVSGTLHGWAAGAGVEYKNLFVDGWNFRLEYIHADFGDIDNSGPYTSLPGASSSSANSSAGIETDTVRVGMTMPLNF